MMVRGQILLATGFELHKSLRMLLGWVVRVGANRWKELLGRPVGQRGAQIGAAQCIGRLTGFWGCWLLMGSSAEITPCGLQSLSQDRLGACVGALWLIWLLKMPNNQADIKLMRIPPGHQFKVRASLGTPRNPR